MPYSQELKTAIEAVKKACSLCTTVQTSLVSEETMTKKDKSPVTVADFGVQAVICHELKKAFPNDPIVAEEDSADLKSEEGRALTKKVFGKINFTCFVFWSAFHWKCGHTKHFTGTFCIT